VPERGASPWSVEGGAPQSGTSCDDWIEVLMIDDAVRAAVRAEVAPVLDELRRLRSMVEHKSTGPALEPLDKILPNCSTAAARMKIARDPGLRALGLRVCRRLLFSRDKVVAYFAQRSVSSL
jgi:hypothetical protein